MSKRADRRWRTHLVIIRRVKDAQNIGYGFRIIQNGRFKKKHPFDCGHSRCFTCHFTKILNIPTHRDILSELSFSEQLEELLDRI